MACWVGAEKDEKSSSCLLRESPACKERAVLAGRVMRRGAAEAAAEEALKSCCRERPL